MRISAQIVVACWLRRLGLAGAMLTSVAADATAQPLIVGTVRDAVSALPVDGASIILVDERSSIVAVATSTSDGRFELVSSRVVARATVIIHAAGYHPGSADVDPSPSPSARRRVADFTIAPRPRPLPTRHVRGTERCSGDDHDRLQSVIAWERAVTAFKAQREQQPTAPREWIVAMSRREFTTADESPTNESRTILRVWSAVPFVAAPRDSVALAGYWNANRDATRYEAPDLDLLFSEITPADYCIIRIDDGRNEGFQLVPASDTVAGAISGYLWLVRGTTTPLQFNFTYSGVHQQSDSTPVGGTIDFIATPTGEWVIRRWSIRWPKYQSRVLLGSGGLASGTRQGQVRTGRRRVGYVEIEAELVSHEARTPP